MSASMPTRITFERQLMTVYDLSHISAFSVSLPLSVAIWKRYSIWRKFSLLVILLLIGAASDFISYLSIKHHGSNILCANIYQIVEFSLLVWLFKTWPSTRKSNFHLIIFTMGLALWIIDFLIVNSLYTYSSMFRVTGSMLLVFVCIDQINFTILNRDDSISFSRMLIKVGFVLYFFYKAVIESFDLFGTQIQFPYSAQFWYIHDSLSILLNVLIAIAFICYRTKPTQSILT